MVVRWAELLVGCWIVMQSVPATAQAVFAYPAAPAYVAAPYAAPPGPYDDGNVVVVDRNGRPIYFEDGRDPHYQRPYAYPYSANPYDEGRVVTTDPRFNPTDGRVSPPAFVPPGQGQVPSTQQLASLPPEDGVAGSNAGLPPQYRHQIIAYTGKEPAGTIIVDTAHTYLYYVLGHGQAIRYGIGVGREGFTWSGREKISRMAEWPDWYPPAEMIERQPYLPRMMAGGPGNPLGARALYLGNTLYRIHGTNDPTTIGKYVSSGCIRLTNADVEDLYRRVHVGTRVVVLPAKPHHTATTHR